jgi:AbrB family looped-hinge helix DNA binding protein
MTITIDRAGRVVLPKAIRDRFHLRPGTEIEITAEPDAIKLARRDSRPVLVTKRGVLVHTGGEALDLDIAAFIADHRAARGASITTEHENPRAQS